MTQQRLSVDATLGYWNTAFLTGHELFNMMQEIYLLIGRTGTLFITLLLLSSPAYTEGQSAQTEPYKINPGDVLAINVWNEEGLTIPQLLVRPDGYISMPLVGDVSAGGNSIHELQQQLKQRLTKYLRDEPILTVTLLQLNGNTVFVLGKVNRPGVYPMNASIDVVQALAVAGGLAMFADEDDIQILRRDANGKQTATRVRYDRIINGKDLETNILLSSGDIVMVP